MKLWQDLISTAIVGTDRQKLTLHAHNGEFADFFQNFQNDAGEIALLKAAAVVATYRRTGTKSTVDKNPPPEAAPPETAAFIGKQSEQHLAAMLFGNHKDILPEFLILVANHKQVISPQFLPEILDFGNSERELRVNILPVLGERGHWLTGNNSDWRWALSEENVVEIWQDGSRAERLLAFEVLRRQDSVHARELLSADWKSESAKDRTAFLEILRTNLSDLDEPFLNEVLRSDKSTDVRRTAFDLLSRLPHSNLVEELTKRAAQVVEVKKGGILSKPKLEINFPREFENLSKDDVLNFAFSLNSFVPIQGKKGLALCALLTAVPLKYWLETFEVNPKILFQAVSNSDWNNEVLRGFVISAGRIPNVELTAEIAKTLLYPNFFEELKRVWKGLVSPLEFFGRDFIDAVLQLPPSQIESMTMDLLDFHRLPLDGKNPAIWLLQNHESQWSIDLTKKFAERVDYEVRNSKSKFLYWSIYGVMESFAKFIPVDSVDKFEVILEKHEKIEGNWKNNIQKIVQTLNFRRELNEGFKNKL